MQKTYKNCQSCGMPLNRDEEGGGTNADGSRNERYCSHCFQFGRFVLPDITVEQMQARVCDQISESGIPRFVANLLSKSVPKLERWQEDTTGRPGATGSRVNPA